MTSDTVSVTFHLSIGLVGCEMRETIEIPRDDLPPEGLERDAYLEDYANDVFNGQIEMYWRIEAEA